MSHPINNLVPYGVYVDDDGTVTVDIVRFLREHVYEWWMDGDLPSGMYTLNYLGQTVTVESTEEGPLIYNGDILAT